MRIATAALILSLFAARNALPQADACPGGRVVTGFQLRAAPAKANASAGFDDALPLDAVNNLGSGDTLRYAPSQLPAVWRGSARVAVLLLPSASDVNPQLSVFTESADKPAVWKVPDHVGAIAFLFGPDGFNPQKSRSLLAAHPELVTHFTQYADQASRVEALIALLARYEQSPPGTLDLNVLLKQYSAAYGITLPKVNPNLPPDETAEELLAALAPPTALSGPSSHAALTAGSTDTATALASLYFGPAMGLANGALPLFRALHQSLFPGTQFQGAFAQSAPPAMRLCMANTATPAQNHPVYIWMVHVPGGDPPAVRLAQGSDVNLPVNGQAEVRVLCATVAQLRQLGRARQWQLLPASGAPIPISVAVAATDLNDTLGLDLRHLNLPPGPYHLAARWDWTPIAVQGVFHVRPVAGLASATLAADAEDHLVAGAGLVDVHLTGADYTFVNKVELVAPKAAAETLAFDPPAAGAAAGLTVKLDLAKLPPGAYQLRLSQVNGAAQQVPLAILPPNPSLDRLPLRANLGDAAQPVTLHGAHLERIRSIASPDAVWTLAPLAPPDASAPAGPLGLTERAAAVTLDSRAQPDQRLPARLAVAGLPDPVVIDDALRVFPPRPKVHRISLALPPGGTIALLDGELPADGAINFAFSLDLSLDDPAIRLGCQNPDALRKAVTLHPGESSGPHALDAGGDGLFYLAALPGEIGEPGCLLQLTVLDPDRGDSDPYPLGRIVRLPRIDRFTLSDASPGPDLYAGELAGQDLQLIAKTGWSPDVGVPVTALPLRGAPASAAAQSPTAQTLAIAMPWPPPSPHAPLYIWLRGESLGRKTTITP